jgi:hypothetical protein
MKLKMVITFDPFEVSAPELRAAIIETAAGKTVVIETHPARDKAPDATKRANDMVAAQAKPGTMRS